MRQDWQINSLEEVVKFIDYRGKTPLNTEYGMRLITAKNLKMGYLQNEPMEFVDPKIYDEWMTRGIQKKGDVLFTSEANQWHDRLAFICSRSIRPDAASSATNIEMSPSLDGYVDSGGWYRKRLDLC